MSKHTNFENRTICLVGRQGENRLARKFYAEIRFATFKNYLYLLYRNVLFVIRNNSLCYQARVDTRPFDDNVLTTLPANNSLLLVWNEPATIEVRSENGVRISVHSIIFGKTFYTIVIATNNALLYLYDFSHNKLYIGIYSQQFHFVTTVTSTRLRRHRLFLSLHRKGARLCPTKNHVVGNYYTNVVMKYVIYLIIKL